MSVPTPADPVPVPGVATPRRDHSSQHVLRYCSPTRDTRTDRENPVLANHRLAMQAAERDAAMIAEQEEGGEEGEGDARHQEDEVLEPEFEVELDNHLQNHVIYMGELKRSSGWREQQTGTFVGRNGDVPVMLITAPTASLMCHRILDPGSCFLENGNLICYKFSLTCQNNTSS
jgi:hypothetical protein